MKEIERKEVVARIQNDFAEKEALKVQYEELKELASNPVVVQYLKLLADIKRKKRNQVFFKSDDETINLEFVWAFESRIKGKNMSPCYHGIWLYEGSYYLSADPLGEHDKELRAVDETHEDFIYNSYVCLECGKRVDTKNWKEFEDDHFVLKNQNNKDGFDVSYYRYLYYKLLYSHNVTEAQEKVIEEFYRNYEETNPKSLNKKMDS